MCANFSRFSTRTQEFHTCASFSGVARDTDQGVETCAQVSLESHPSGTDGDRMRGVDRLRRYRRQHRWTCPQLRLFFCGTDQGVQHVCTCFSSRDCLDPCSADNRP